MTKNNPDARTPRYCTWSKNCTLFRKTFPQNVYFVIERYFVE